MKMRYMYLPPSVARRQTPMCRAPRCVSPPDGGKGFCTTHFDLHIRRENKLEGKAFAQVATILGLTNIYAIRCENRIKIGVALDVHHRLGCIQTSNPYPVELLAYSVSYRKTEKELHRKLKAHHVRGEWFDACDPVMAVVEQIKLGAFVPVRS